MRKIIPYNSKLKKLASELRKKMTFSEVLFWKLVSGYAFMGYDFHRQKPILNYIVDFYCEELSLVIEIDRITHHDRAVQLKDTLKESDFRKLGLSVMRFSSFEIIKDMQNVVRTLKNLFWNLKIEMG